MSASERTFKGEDLSGQTFARLTVLSLVGFKRFPKRPSHRKAIWACLCQCGKRVNVIGEALKSGNTKSCGCLDLEVLLHRSTKHGHYPLSGASPIRVAWNSMIQRCTNPRRRDWKWYGAKGVQVCERWKSFTNFLADMGPTWQLGLTLDRFPNTDGDYEPINCRWATWKQQANNRNPRHGRT